MAVPKPNKSGELIDLLRAAGVECELLEKHHAALKRTRLSAAEVAEVYIAIAEGRFGDDWLCDNVNVERAIAAWPNYQNRKLRGPRPRRGESPEAIAARVLGGAMMGGRDAAVLSWAVQKLATAFPVSFRDEAALKARAVLLAELCQQHPWVTTEVLRRAVYLVAWQHQSEYTPPPAIFLDYCEAARVDLERDATARARKLPPPAPPTDDERRAQEDRVEAAKLRARLSLPERLRKKYRPGGGYPKEWSR